MKYNFFALDIDGTVFSSEDIIYPTYKEAIDNFCRDSGIELVTPDRDRIMLEIGKPVKTIFQNLLPQLTEDQRDAISDSVLDILCNKIAAGEGEYYPQVAFTVEMLLARGAKILIASNGRRPYIEAILRYLKIWKHVIHPTFIDGAKILSKGDILASYVERGIDARQILMVGDRLSDLEAARHIGCDFAWCAYGHAPPGEIQSYEVRLENFADLAEHA